LELAGKFSYFCRRQKSLLSLIKYPNPLSISPLPPPLLIPQPILTPISRPVGSGKTALMYELCRALRNSYSIAAVTNDIFTREDAEFLIAASALPAARVRAIQTGGCPHAAIREDISENYHALLQLHQEFSTDLLLIESGGDNLAANYSRELADFIIYVIDVAGGDKVPRKGGPGTTGSDLLVINKCDLAGAVGADLERMEKEARMMREGGPVVMAVVKDLKGGRPAGYEDSVSRIVELILSKWKSTDAYAISVKRWREGGERCSGVMET
jgi:urease accessory protein